MRQSFSLLLLVAPLLVTLPTPLGADSQAADDGRTAVGSSAWVGERVQSWQPTSSERRWATIGWTAGLSDALRLGKEHQRPIFLFTLDGRMGAGRC